MFKSHDNTNSTIEEWRDIPDYEGLYQASNLGNVRRIVDMERGRYPAYGLLKQRHNNDGYLVTSLTKDKKDKDHRVHRLVLLAFLGAPRYPNWECHHINEIRDDNRIENLEWIDHAVNVRISWENPERGVARGEDQGSAKLTNEQVLEIRRRYGEGNITQKQLAVEYNTNQGNISAIIRRASWRHIP